jgi:hypothetical protein
MRTLWVGQPRCPRSLVQRRWFFQIQTQEKEEELATVSNLQPLTLVPDIYTATQQADIEVDAVITVGRETIWISRYK